MSDNFISARQAHAATERAKKSIRDETDAAMEPVYASIHIGIAAGRNAVTCCIPLRGKYPALSDRIVAELKKMHYAVEVAELDSSSGTMEISIRW